MYTTWPETEKETVSQFCMWISEGIEAIEWKSSNPRSLHIDWTVGYKVVDREISQRNNFRLWTHKNGLWFDQLIRIECPCLHSPTQFNFLFPACEALKLASISDVNMRTRHNHNYKVGSFSPFSLRPPEPIRRVIRLEQSTRNRLLQLVLIHWQPQRKERHTGPGVSTFDIWKSMTICCPWKLWNSVAARLSLPYLQTSDTPCTSAKRSSKELRIINEF